MEKKNTSQNNTFYPTPVVTLLGHVDHGKTSLLDAIRKSSVAESEHGGITQRIGAYQIEVPHEGRKSKITFIDTPGHEAFAKMRHRGGRVADIGLLIISSVEGIMPQTKESMEVLEDSKTPFIVVFTKSDLPEKNTEKIKGQLVSQGVKLEGYGGNIPVIEVSAKTGSNIKELLGLILLFWEMQGKPSTGDSLEGVVIESKLDKNSGPKGTVVIKSGKIKTQDEIFCADIKGKVKSLTNDKGERLREANVGDAVEVLGFEKVPPVGGIIVHSAHIARGPVSPSSRPTSSVAGSLRSLDGTPPGRATPPPPSEATSQFLNNREEDEKKLSIILSADTLGTLEAIVNALPEDINIAQQKTGDITTADVFFAKSIGAIIVGFNVKVLPEAQKLIAVEKVLFRNYRLIYELIQELKDAAEGKKLSYEEEVFGIARVKASFPYEKTKVMGVEVMEGRMAKGDKVRIVRGEEVIGETTLSSLRQGKEQTSKVEEGKEAGVIVSPLVDFDIGDMLISHS